MKYLFSLFLLLFAEAICAEKKPITLTEAVTIGLEHSPQLHSSQMNMNASAAKADETFALQLPSIKFTGAYTRLSEIPEASIPSPIQTPGFPSKFTISPSVFDNYLTKLSVTQPLFMGNKLTSANEIAHFSSEISQNEYQKEKADVILTITQSYWGLYKAMEFQKLIEENVHQMQAHLTDVQNLLQQGMATKNDVLKVQVQLSNIQLLQMDAANTILLTSYSLNSLLGVPLSTELQPIETAIFQPTEISSLENLVQDALLYRPEIKNMDLRIKSSDAGVTLAKSGWYPQVFLSGNYNYARPNQRIFPTQDEFKNTWDVSLGVSFDVWNWNTTSYQTTQAEALQSQAQFGMQQLKDGIILEVTQHYLNNKQAQEKIAVAEQGKLQAEENYRTSSEKFRNGLLQNSELLDAEVLLLQSKTNYTQALIDYHIAKAQLTRAT